MEVKFAFIGGGFSGLELVKALLKENHIPQFAIILKEDEHETEKHSDKIFSMLNERNIKAVIKKKLTAEDYELIKKSGLDFMFVFGWRTLIDIDLCGRMKHGIVAAHYSLLPKYRGFAPVQWAIINGEKETGVTLFRISNDGIDSGGIIFQKKLPIMNSDTSFDVIKKLSGISTELFLKFFRNVNSGKIKLRKQKNSLSTYCCKRIPEDGRINWNRSSVEIYNLIRALAPPFPMAFCYFGDECYSIKKAKIGESNKRKFVGKINGRVIKISNDGAEVICGDGTLLLEEWENKISGKVSCPSEIIKSFTSTLT